ACLFFLRSPPAFFFCGEPRAFFSARRTSSCAFGAAGTVSIANALVDPSVALLESGLSVGYGLLIGLVIGYVVIRVDLALTGSRGRRARRDEQASAVRPEPRRTAALL
ncbi:MAG: hypothetical protein VX747_06160, partial [Actinomycetota bacterium]|nr:hypothetical protein [Actinomycetota bacterium]